MTLDFEDECEISQAECSRAFAGDVRHLKNRYCDVNLSTMPNLDCEPTELSLFDFPELSPNVCDQTIASQVKEFFLYKLELTTALYYYCK